MGPNSPHNQDVLFQWTYALRLFHPLHDKLWSFANSVGLELCAAACAMALPAGVRRQTAAWYFDVFLAGLKKHRSDSVWFGSHFRFTNSNGSQNHNHNHKCSNKHKPTTPTRGVNARRKVPSCIQAFSLLMAARHCLFQGISACFQHTTNVYSTFTQHLFNI